MTPGRGGERVCKTEMSLMLCLDTQHVMFCRRIRGPGSAVSAMVSTLQWVDGGGGEVITSNSARSEVRDCEGVVVLLC